MSAFGPQRSWYHKLDGYGKPMRPTIEPTPGFSASADAERLHRAVKGAGTDEQTIIDILAHRTNHERQQICAAYQNQYNRSLRQDLKDDTSGDFRTVLCELVHDMPYLLAKALYYAMKGHGTNERVLIEVMVTLWNDEMQAVAEAYKQVLKDEKIDDPKRTLSGDIKKDTSGDFEYALGLLAWAERDDIPALQLKAIPEKGIESVVNRELAQADAEELYKSGAGQLGTTEQRISRVLCGRTTFQVAADAEAYEKATGTSLLVAMEKELTGDYRKLIKALIRYATDRPNLIAEWFHDALSGLGTRDYTLMRLVISRSEIDLQDVQEAYAKKYGRTLAAVIKSDTSGDYSKTLLAMLERP